eukprot:1157867-Pelagomonas_calceolata.AAC.2
MCRSVSRDFSALLCCQPRRAAYHTGTVTDDINQRVRGTERMSVPGMVSGTAWGSIRRAAQCSNIP